MQCYIKLEKQIFEHCCIFSKKNHQNVLLLQFFVMDVYNQSPVTGSMAQQNFSGGSKTPLLSKLEELISVANQLQQ